MKRTIAILLLLAAALSGCKEENVPEVEVAAIKMSSNSISLVVGSSRQLTAETVPANATDKTIEWKSSDSSVAGVSSDGLVSAVAPGDATVTATASNGVSASCQVTVTAARVPVTGVSLSPLDKTMAVEESFELTASVFPENATDQRLVWGSSKENVAIVLNGVVSAVGVGSCVISVTTVDGGFNATCAVTVKDNATTLGGEAEGFGEITNQYVWN